MLAVAMPMLAKGLGYDPGNAFVMCLLNPLVVLTLVGGAHNDGLMMALLVAGLALAVRKHPVWGIVVCALAASIKAPAALGIRLHRLGVARPGGARAACDFGRSPSRRGSPPRCSGVCTVVLGSRLRVGRQPATRRGRCASWAAPATGIGMGLAALGHAVGLGVSTDVMISVVA